MALVRAGATAALLALIVFGLATAWSERNRTYASFFEGGVKLAAPLVDFLGSHIEQGEVVNVALWLQPSVMRRLGLTSRPELIEAAEVIATTRGSNAETAATWILLTPGLYEAPGVQWIRSVATSGKYDAVASSPGGEFTLLRLRDENRMASGR